MVFPIVGGTQDTGYKIDNSLRFADSNYLTRDNTSQSGAGDNFTFSAWVKMSTYGHGGYQGIFSIFKDSNDYFEIYKDNGLGDNAGSENLQICQNINGTNVCYQIQDYEFADYSAWYHLVINFNNSESSEVDKVSIYVNGTEIAGAVTNSNPFDDVGLGSTDYDTRVGAYRDNTSATWNGYMADVHLIAGQTLAASYFGETNDNGVWIPKKYTGTFGANGFKLKFLQTGTSQNSSGIGADTSGEDNHLAVTGIASGDVTTDTPTNNFATLNPIDKAGNGAVTLSEGNLKAAVEDNGNTRGSIYVNSGKWYWETLIVSGDSVATVGIAEPGFYSGNLFDSSSTAKGYIYINNGQKRSPAGSASSYGSSYANDDIIGVALNMDDGEVKFYKNNTVQNSGTAAFTSLSGDHGIYYQGYGGTATVILNTGHDSSFAGEKTAQNNTDENGYGDFYYSPPSGFYALNTKNLAEYG